MQECQAGLPQANFRGGGSREGPCTNSQDEESPWADLITASVRRLTFYSLLSTPREKLHKETPMPWCSLGNWAPSILAQAREQSCLKSRFSPQLPSDPLYDQGFLRHSFSRRKTGKKQCHPLQQSTSVIHAKYYLRIRYFYYNSDLLTNTEVLPWWIHDWVYGVDILKQAACEVHKPICIQFDAYTYPRLFIHHGILNLSGFASPHIFQSHNWDDEMVPGVLISLYHFQDCTTQIPNAGKALKKRTVNTRQHQCSNQSHLLLPFTQRMTNAQNDELGTQHTQFN